MKKLLTTSIVVLAIAAAAAAQTPAPAAPAKPVNLGDLRHHIYVMEGALARAVDYGAKQLNREILQVMPGVFMLEGEARARGVHLDRSEEHTSELQSQSNLVCRLLLEKKKQIRIYTSITCRT